MGEKTGRLRRKRKEKPEPLTFEGVAGACLQGSLQRTAGENLQVSVEPMSFDRFENSLDSVERGTVIASFSRLQEPAFLLLAPGEDSLTDELPGHLPLLYFLQEASASENDTGSDAASSSKAAAYTPGFFLTLPKPYSFAEKNDLLWQASGCVIYKISGRPVTGRSIFEGPSAEIYLCSRRDFDKMIRKKLQEPGFDKTVRKLIPEEQNQEEPEEQEGKKPEAPAEAAESGGLDIARPFEFILGSLFLPLRAVVGKKKIFCTFKTAVPRKLAGSVIPDDGIWYRFSFQTDEKPCTVYYGVDVKGQVAKYSTFFTRLFQGLLQNAGRKLRKEVSFSGAKGGISGKPKDNFIARAAVFTAEIGMERQHIPCTVCVERAVLGLLAGRMLEPQERRFLQHHPQRELLLTASLNQTFFRKNIEVFYQETLDRNIPESGPPGLYGLRVSELINLIDDDDVKRIIQNYFIGNGFGIGDMQKLFFYKTGPDENDRFKVTIDTSFDNSRFVRLLPRVPREEWKRVHAVSENYRELIESNAAAMQGIYNAVFHNKLLLSFKSRYILDLEFREKIEEEYMERVQVLLEEGEPLRSLQMLTRETAQQVVSAVPTKKLAVLLLSRTEDTRKYVPFMSRNKRKELSEEMKVQKRRRESGQLTAELIYDSMLEIRDAFLQAAERQRAQQL